MWCVIIVADRVGGCREGDENLRKCEGRNFGIEGVKLGVEGIGLIWV